MHKKGRIAGSEAEKLMNSIENRMKELRDTPPDLDLPDVEELLSEVSWLKNANHDFLHEISSKFESKIFSSGDILLHEGKTEDGMYIIVRGNIKITINGELIDLLGPGNTIGEVAALSKNKRTATVTAETPLTVLWISSKGLKQLIDEHQEIGENLWQITGTRYAYYLLKDIAPFNKLSKKQFEKEIKKGIVIKCSANEQIDLTDKTAILIHGSVNCNNNEIEPPSVLKNDIYTMNSDSVLFSIDELT
ncbi:MAG: hypothetical protein A3K10_12225 [Bacteroidetes bacterium RIFCSPLOWO2_12_FULL_31_6]|nr:MAG: hypothetical protein A3K10_12225 [Bacteroidetes bacterium RIFCSPLOWO2_12_FULL_31_6]